MSLNPIAPMSDQDRISPHNIIRILSRQVTRIKILIRGLLVDPIPNSPTNITRTIWRTVRRVTNEVVGVKGLAGNCKMMRVFPVTVKVGTETIVLRSTEVAQNRKLEEYRLLRCDDISLSSVSLI